MKVKKISQYRSAGACPPRTFGRPQHGEGQALALRGKRISLTQKPACYRSAGACPPRSFRRSKHGEGQAPALRERAAFFIVARGPVPRERSVDRSMARDRPSPYVKGDRFSPKKPSCYRSAGACPPRSFRRSKHGEGQALALRGRGMFFSILLSIATIFG